MEFKDRMRELRMENDISATQLAGKLNKTEGAVRMWETGRSKPDADTIIILSNYFGVSVDYLLGVSDVRNPENEATVQELGLSEKSVEVLKRYKGLMLGSNNNKDDPRSLSDVVSAILESEYSWTFISSIGYASSAALAAEKGFDEIDGVGRNLSTADIYKMLAHENLDSIIKELYLRRVMEWGGLR